jgi:hypothetical protein
MFRAVLLAEEKLYAATLVSLVAYQGLPDGSPTFLAFTLERRPARF